MKKITAHSAKFSTNLSIVKNKLKLRMITRFIFKIAFIILYLFDFFFLIKNHELRYELWQNFKIFRLIRFFNIFVITFVKILKIENFEIYYARCFIILIICEKTIFDRIFFIFENFHDKTIFRLYNISIKRFCFWIVNSFFTIILSNRLNVNRKFRKIFENFEINRFLYDLLKFFKIFFFFQKFIFSIFFFIENYFVKFVWINELYFVDFFLICDVYFNWFLQKRLQQCFHVIFLKKTNK